jgi:hypothetical protein
VSTQRHSNPSRDREKLRKNRLTGESACPTKPQVVCLQWWGMLQLANARLRAHFFSASEGAVASSSVIAILH